MPTDPFVVLGIAKNSSQSEILDAYKTKREYFSQHVFDEGEAGAEAARRLEELDNAYQVAMELSHEGATVSEQPASFDDVKQALKDKKPEEAQRILDNISYRNAEWHYFQSIIFYEKSWLNDSKSQLEIALELEPGNEKYLRALENLKKKINGARPFENNAQKEQTQTTYTQTNRSYSQPNQNSTAGDGLCAACQTLWCADCCCECMGGDLISCC